VGELPFSLRCSFKRVVSQFDVIPEFGIFLITSSVNFSSIALLFEAYFRKRCKSNVVTISPESVFKGFSLKCKMAWFSSFLTPKRTLLTCFLSGFHAILHFSEFHLNEDDLLNVACNLIAFSISTSFLYCACQTVPSGIAKS